MKDNLSEKELREFVKDVMASSLKEFDVLLPKNKSDWKDEAVTLRKTFVELMKNIESDDFSDGIKKIDSAIKHLENWKLKLEKFL
jgi:hypothetical protein